MNNLKSMETLTIENNIYEVNDEQARLDIQNLNAFMLSEAARNAETDAKYFDIDASGLVSLKPEYRGDASDIIVNSSGEVTYPFAVSDNGIGFAGSKINELPERIVIPSVINEIAVTSLPKGMFFHNDRVKEIVLPDHITKIPRSFCREALNLRSVENTELITHIEASAFNQTSIQRALFPNLQQLESSAFSKCPLLVVADIGNTIISIPDQCFMTCEKLSAVLGGSSVTSVGNFSFHSTRRLKNLSFLSQLTNIGHYAFFGSRVNFDGNSVADTCTFGTNATYKQFNDTDYWSNCTYKSCERPLLSLFHQSNPAWASETICNNTNGTTYSKGCSIVCMAEIYSALEGVKFSSPKEFESVLASVAPELMAKDLSDINDTFAAFVSLGYSTTHYESIGETELQYIYDALADGALVYKSIMIQGNLDEGHVVVVYGVNDIGELLVTDSAPFNNLVGVYENLTYAMPIQALGTSQCDVIIVQKTNSSN